MKISCPTCGSESNLPQDKVPKDRDFSFKCPQCSASVPVKAPGAGPGPGSGNTSRLQAGGPKKVLVCTKSCPGRDRVAAGLKNAGFTVDIVESPEQALKKLKYQVYPLVMVDEVFDQDKTMTSFMDNLDMFLRRKICLVRVGSDLETGNPMTALNMSANYVIKSQDFEQEDANLVDNALAVALTEHEQMYAVFNDSMKAVGKA